MSDRPDRGRALTGERQVVEGSSPRSPTAVVLTSGVLALTGRRPRSPRARPRSPPRGDRPVPTSTAAPALGQRPDGGTSGAAGARTSAALPPGVVGAPPAAAGVGVSAAIRGRAPGSAPKLSGFRGADPARGLARLVGQGERPCLADGHVEAHVASPRARALRSRAPRAPPRPLIAHSGASPSSASAAFCIAGEREWPTGSRSPQRGTIPRSARLVAAVGFARFS